MKQLKDMVELPNELETHFLYEFMLNDSFNYSYINIYEKYGAYIGQNELIFYLAKTIYKETKKNKKEQIFTLNSKDLSDYSNIFFDNITIKINTTIGGSGYYPKKSKYNKKNMFDNVFICLRDYDCVEYTNIVRCLMHEMLHAYNNYQSYVTNATFNLYDLIKTNTPYNKTLSDNQDISTTNICKRIVNNIRKLEKNAYISELSILLETYKFDIYKYHNVIDAYKDAVNIFKSSDVWYQYSILYQYVIDMKNENELEKNEFVSTYNNINNTDLTFHKIIKRLNAQFVIILKRIESTVPKIFYEYYQKQLNIKNESLIRPTSSLINFLQYMNDFEGNCGIWTINQ